jgi:glucose/arabinose dehydrogenase
MPLMPIALCRILPLIPILAALPSAAPPASINDAPPNAVDQKPAFPGQTRAPERASTVAFDVVTVASDLAFPWGMAFLPDGRMLVTERPGRMRLVGPDGVKSEPIQGLPAVDARGQGGLLDVALDPAFARNRLVYWSFAQPRGAEGNGTAVARGRLNKAASRFENVQVIFEQRPSLDSVNHFGGRLLFVRDGTLLITLGERSELPGRVQAQRLDGTLGKIVRIKPDGSIPQDNPFVKRAGARAEIWSIGHRNVQGVALQPRTGDVWAVEHGAKGGDEINLIRKGHDYGWPSIAYGIEYDGRTIGTGPTRQTGMEQPIYYWDPVIAPSGLAFYSGNLFPAWRGSLFVGGLRGMLVRLEMDGKKVTGEERLLTDLHKRIRDVRQGPDGALYLLTDAMRGDILKLTPRH